MDKHILLITIVKEPRWITDSLKKKKKSHTHLSETAVGPCLCELASGLVRKLQGTGAKASRPDYAYVSWYLAL
jgi:hypothetical protein